MNVFPPRKSSKATALVRLIPSEGSMPANVEKVYDLAGRVLLSFLFLQSGVGSLAAYGATAEYMTSAGVPDVLLPLAITTELLGAAAIVLGWQTRIAAFLLAGYTLLTALLFHANFGDTGETIHFMKNVSIAGGFLLLVANGAGLLSVDRRVHR